MIEPWQDPHWLAGAVSWVDDRLAEAGLERTGDAEQVHVQTWATVLRVPTAGGPVWFKANSPELRHEAVVVGLLAHRGPDRVPPLLADDEERGWMLMADAGRRLREVVEEERTLHRWHDVLAGVADLHRALEGDVDRLVTTGVPDMRLATLPDRYAELLDRVEVEPRFHEAVPRVKELAEELAAYGLPETLQHDDLHDGQVYVRHDPDGRERNVILDWGDACVSHPFFTLSVTLEGVVSWGLDDEEDSEELAPYVDGYLARYAPGRPELREAVPTALRLGWVCRAVNGHVVGDDDHTRTRLRMFLDGKP